MSDKSEPICFVPTGKGAVRGDATPSADGNFMLVSHGEYGDEEPGYRRLPAGWVDAAVERVRKFDVDSPLRPRRGI